jgi:hypothetical protein
MKLIFRLLMLGVVGSIVFTWWALEADGVAVIETQLANGSTRQTHVWYAEPDGQLWLEAGTAENGWYTDVQRAPGVSFTAGEISGRYVARNVPGESAHGRVRALFREKYGIRDWWISLIFDTSNSVAVQLISEEDLREF